MAYDGGVVERYEQSLRPSPEKFPKPTRMQAHGSELDHFKAFCQEHLIQSVDNWDGKPLILEPFQIKFMEEALKYDERGLPLWLSVVLVVARKNGKTHLLSAYALYRLLTSEGAPEILLAASSDKQAGRLFDACVSFIRNSVYLSSLLRIREYDGEIVREDGRGRILRMASDSKRLQGYSPSLVVCDELAQWTTPGLEKAYAALTSGGGARSAPQIFSITTAGDWITRHDSILGRIVDAAQAAEDQETSPGLTIARMHTARMLAYIYEAPTTDPRNIKAMLLANPASWITAEYLASQAANPQMSDADVLQLHGCVWSETELTWLLPGAWKALRSPHTVPEGPVVLGFDGSYNRDSTALVGCTLTGHLFVVKVWERPDGAPNSWRIPRAQVNDAVAQAMEAYEVVELAPDPPGWTAEIEVWEETYGAVVVRFETNQNARMAPAVDRFQAAVIEQTITHDGNPILARHVANCVSESRRSGTVIKKYHDSKKIDSAVASVVAYERAMWHVNKPAFDTATLVW